MFNGSVAKCVKRAADCGNLYVSDKHMACVDTPSTCLEYLHGRAYSGTDANECTLDCEGKGGYYYGDECITAAQCTALGLHPYIYGTSSGCAEYVPASDGNFDPTWLDSGVYKCTDTLLDITGNAARCILKDACKEFTHIASMCMTRDQCLKGGYLYESESEKSCIYAWRCRGKGFTYAVTRECSPLKPDTDSNLFVERYRTEHYF